MREILFKAKRIDNGEWVEGFYTYCDGKHYIRFLTDETSRYTRGFFEVDPSTICQYTGLVDKDGKKIFENDIVSFTHLKITSESLAKELGFLDFEKEEYKRNYVIEYVNTYCTYGLRFRNKSIHFPCKASTLWMHDCVVIGNVFDNEDLLNE